MFIALWLWAPSTVGAETLTIGGTGGDLGTIRQLGAAFEKTAAGEGVTVNVLDSLGSGGGIRAAKASVLEIAISSRTLKDKERAPGLKIFAYAKTAMVIVANNTHGLSGISAAELARIYRGETRNWPDGTAYRIVLRPKGDTDTQIVKNQL
ncbi:MAG: substrate-binding domain-containing protein, partial [Proteobacteria bacterium]|nr:substrate-binding domain-containing protein [Pseudomonadota bacterium]